MFLTNGFFRRWIYVFKIVIPLTVSVGIMKLILHGIGWEMIGSNMLPFLTSVFTGIIFMMGFVLAGLLSDHKESEKLPAEIIACLYSISREADLLKMKGEAAVAWNMQENIYQFVHIFRSDFLLKQSDTIFKVVDSFTKNFYAMDEKGVSQPSMARLKNDQANLERILLRMKTIRDTMFAPGVHSAVEGIVVLFGVALLFFRFDSFVSGMFFMCFSIFLLSSIFILIKDLENPFEYDKKAGANEIDFSLVFAFEDTIRKRLKED